MYAFFQSARKSLRGFRLPIVSSVLFMSLAACDPSAIGDLGEVGNLGSIINRNKPVKVALLVPRGSSSDQDTILAQNLENAARLAMRDLDGIEIDLQVYGTQGNAAVAAQQAVKAVEEGAKIILGPVYAEAANAAGVAIAEHDVNLLSFSNNASIAGGNVYILGNTFQNTANRMVSYAKKKSKDRIVIAHATDVAGQLARNAIQKAAVSQGATVVDSIGYPLSQEGVIAAVPRIKAAVSAKNANALFLTAPSAAELPMLSQLLPEAGVTGAVSQYVGLTRWDIPPTTLGLPGLQGGWFALPDPASQAVFQSKYNGAYGTTPHPISGVAFDAMATVAALLKSKKPQPFSTKALTQGAGFKGASGVFRLLPDGTNQRAMAIAAIQNKSVVILDQAPKSFGGAGF